MRRPLIVLGNPEGKAGGMRTESRNATTLSINGTKFEDLNGNAVFDDDERGLSGWVIRLNLDGIEISNTTTDDSGRYLFYKPSAWYVYRSGESEKRDGNRVFQVAGTILLT